MDVTAGTLTEQFKLTHVFVTSQDGNLCKSIRLLHILHTEFGIMYQSLEGRSRMLGILQLFPSTSGGLTHRERMLKGMAVRI